MKSTLSAKCLLTCSMVLFFGYASSGQKCMYGWKYDVPVTITNSTSANLTNYQVKITLNTAVPISNGKMMADGADIRFADTTTCANLQYWIESGINTTSTAIWIKLPSLAASSSKIIKMYYGNPTAISASNGDSTFLLFDDFSSSTLNTSKWTTYGSSNSNYSLSGGMTVSAGTVSNSTVGSRVFVSTNYYTAPLIAEGFISSTSGFYTSLGLLNSNTWDGYSMYYGDNTAGGNAGMHLGQNYSDSYDFASNIQTTVTSTGTLTGIWEVLWPSSNSQTGIWPNGSTNANVTGVTLGTTLQLAFGQLFTSIGTSTYNWVRLRQYATSDPTAQIGSEQSNHNSGINGVEAFDNNVNIYPNPAKDIIFIDLAGNNENFVSIELMDVRGKDIQILNIQSGKDQYEIPVPNLSNGIYLVRIIGSKGLLMKKIMVE